MLVAAGALLCCSAALEAADEPADRAAAEQAIRQAGKAYLEALERGDAKALAESWTGDGDFIDEFGRSFPAKELIAAEEKAEKKAPEHERVPPKAITSTIRFLSGDVALEDGTSDVAEAAGEGLKAASGRFTAIWVNRDGKWRLASLREARAHQAANGPRLSDLDWMVGQWTGKHGDVEIATTARWNTSHTFLLRDLSFSRDGQVVFSGTQRIGWDPRTRRIKSWNFDSDGGHGEGNWTKDGDTWIVKATGVAPDGQETSSTNSYVYDGKDDCTWKSLGQGSVGVREIKLVRKPAAK